MELQNTNLVVGKKSTELNKLLKQYSQLKEQIADLETTRKQVAEQIITMCDRQAGKYQTSTTVFNVSFADGRVTVSTKALQEKYPNAYNELAVKGQGYFQIKNITPVGKK